MRGGKVPWWYVGLKLTQNHVSLLFLASHQDSPRGQKATEWDFAVPLMEIALDLAGSLPAKQPKQRISV